MIQEHVSYTNSDVGKRILDHFEDYLPKFKKIIPEDYEKMMAAIFQMEEKGLSREKAQIEAFNKIKNGREEARKSGKTDRIYGLCKKRQDSGTAA